MREEWQKVWFRFLPNTPRSPQECLGIGVQEERLVSQSVSQETLANFTDVTLEHEATDDHDYYDYHDYHADPWWPWWFKTLSSKRRYKLYTVTKHHLVIKCYFVIKGYFVTKHYLVIKSYKSSQRKDKERNFIKEVKRKSDLQITYK